MYTFNLLKGGSRGSQLLSGFGQKEQRRELRDSIVSPLLGRRGPGLTMVTLCVGGAGLVPRPPPLQPVLLPYPTGSGSVLGPLGHLPSRPFSHTAHASFSGWASFRAERGRSKTETTGPRKEGT